MTRAPPAGAVKNAWQALHGSPLGRPAEAELMAPALMEETIRDPALAGSIAILCGSGFLPLISGWYHETVRQHVKDVLQPRFWFQVSEFENLQGAVERGQLLVWTSTALRTAFEGLDRSLQCHLRLAACLEGTLAHHIPSGPSTRGGISAHHALMRMAHALVFGPTSTSTTLQQMLHAHLQEQFARVSWHDREAQRRLRTMGVDDDQNGDGRGEDSEDEEDEDEDEDGDTATTGLPVSQQEPISISGLASAMKRLHIAPLCVEVGTQVLFAQINLQIRRVVSWTSVLMALITRLLSLLLYLCVAYVWPVFPSCGTCLTLPADPITG